MGTQDFNEQMEKIRKVNSVTMEFRTEKDKKEQ